MIWQNIRLALNTIRTNKLRSFLTMLGIIIGVASVTSVVALGEGFKKDIQGEINKLGANIITISPGQLGTRDEQGDFQLNQNDFGSFFGSSSLTETDVNTVREHPDIEAAAPIMAVSATVRQGEEKVEGTTVIATNENLPEALNQSLSNGNMFDESTDNNQAVIGGGVASDEFGDARSALTRTITIRGEQYIIVGVMEEIDLGGLGDLGPDLNRAVYISLENGKEYNDGVAFIQEIDAQVAEGADVDETIADLQTAIEENHGGEQDFTILKQEDFLGLTDTFLNLATQFIAAIASISLVVGGIGIMNIMLVSVTERTREIGLRKAIGATNAQVLLQFLIESIIISAIGGLIGVGFAYGAVGLVALFVEEITASFSLEIIFIATGVSAAVGIAAGLWPAYQAARKDPIKSLRHE